MNVKIQSIKFDADKGLIEFIEKKVNKLDKFFDQAIGAEVFLRLENSQSMENKKAEIKILIPGNDLFAERNCTTFEEAIDMCIDALKIQMQKAKDKMQNN